MLTIIEIVEIRIIITSLCLGSCWPTSGARSGKGYSLAGRTSEPKKTYKLTKGSGHAKSAAKQSSWSHSANHWCKFNFNLMKPAIRFSPRQFPSLPLTFVDFHDTFRDTFSKARRKWYFLCRADMLSSWLRQTPQLGQNPWLCPGVLWLTTNVEMPLQKNSCFLDLDFFTLKLHYMLKAE